VLVLRETCDGRDGPIEYNHAKSVFGVGMSAAVATANPEGRKRRVLYAEDQATARIVTTALLERMGFDVEAVEDGELAFEKAKEHSFDVILLDIEMPVMDGVTAARNIRASASLNKEVPILAMSAFLADSTEHSVWRDAFDSALPKPANSNELQRAMQKALLSKKATTADVPHWRMLSESLPPGALSMLVKAAAKEMQHQILAYGACREAGDLETAMHCRKSLKKIATSFEATALHAVLSRHDNDGTWPSNSDLLHAAQSWQTH
jgi:CheY-like chemotaxis protein